MTYSFDVDTDADPLAGFVRNPGAAGAYHERRRVRGLETHRLDQAARFPGGPERVDQFEIVPGRQWRGQPPSRGREPTQDTPTRRGGRCSHHRNGRRTSP